MKALLITAIIAVSGVIVYLSYVLWQELRPKPKRQEVQDRMEILEEMEDEELEEDDFMEVENNEIDNNLDTGSADCTAERNSRSPFADYS